MSAGTGCGLEGSAEVLRALFPFFIEADAEGRIVAVGARWGSLAPPVAIGAQLMEVIAVERPAAVTTLDEVRARPNDVFLVALRSRPDFRLRGQFVSHRVADGVHALFVGSPWMTRIDDLARFGLSLADFPPHDSRGDFLILLQSQESTLADMHLLTQRLRATAEALEVRNNEMARELDLRAQLESELRQSQKMEAVGRLAGGVAHDFNNILMAIQGYATLSLSRLAADDPVRGWIEEMRKAADRATSLTRQLLAFSRRQVLRPMALDLVREVRELETLLRPLIGERIEVRLVATGPLGAVWADATAIQQIVMNLCLNARDAMPLGGVLEVRVGPAPAGDDGARRFAEISVRDTGTGMDEATKARIFEPFFTTKDVGKGSGLGLATVYGLVQQCGGSIEVESELGRGSTFRVLLPLSDAEAAVAQAKAETGALGGRGERILLVEDEPLVRRLLEQLLVRAGYEVSAASDSGEALARVQRPQPIDLVVTDVVMAQMTGPELMQRITALRGPIATVFMSGHTDDETVTSGRLSREQRFMSKPFAPAALLSLVRELLESTRDLR
jgi:signal transduction histidine kinase